MALPVGEHVIEGVLSGLEPKSNGWMRFSVTREGMEWPDKIDTKKPEIIQQATALLGQKVSVAVLVAGLRQPKPTQAGRELPQPLLERDRASRQPRSDLDPDVEHDELQHGRQPLRRRRGPGEGAPDRTYERRRARGRDARGWDPARESAKHARARRGRGSMGGIHAARSCTVRRRRVQRGAS